MHFNQLELKDSNLSAENNDRGIVESMHASAASCSFCNNSGFAP